MFHPQLWVVSLSILLFHLSQNASADLESLDDTTVKSSVYLSPPFFLRPGSVIDKLYLGIPFPKGHFALKSFNAEVVDESGTPIPLHETYLHHWAVEPYYGLKEDAVPRQFNAGQIDLSKIIMKRNDGVCKGNLGQYYGIGSETRKTSTWVPGTYGIEVGKSEDCPDGYEERWMLNIHAIDTRGAEDRLGCTECKCSLYNVTTDRKGNPLEKEYIGGLYCCYDQTQCQVKQGFNDVGRKLYLRYTVRWTDWDESIVPVKIYIFDVTDSKGLTNDSADGNVRTCKVEYVVKPCSFEGSENGECVDVKKTEVVLPHGGDIVYGVAHQHTGGLGSALYGQDRRLLCTSTPTYGEGKEAGNEAGYIVGMSTCYPEPGSVRVADGEVLTVISNYSSLRGRRSCPISPNPLHQPSKSPMGNSCARFKPEIHHVSSSCSVNSRRNSSSKDGKLGLTASGSGSGSSRVSSSSVPPTPRSEGDILNSSNLKSFTFAEVRAATRNFRPDSVLGEGGFGSVFKGWIDENTLAATKPGSGIVIAVKRLNHEGFQGHKEWLAEVNYLGQLYHPNLVRLFGYCLEDEQRLLVYEFMPRGSLENHLFRRGSYFQPLSWNLRMKVALGAAKGLAFLHGPEAKVIYRDFKASNVLLDSHYNAKLSDFGLAKDGPTGDKSHVSTRVMGTHGYAAPEYLATGHLTPKSDVYSFGVVLLEMLSGRRAVDKNRPTGEHNLVEWARPYLTSKRKLFRVMDSRLEGQYSLEAAFKLASLAVHCLSSDGRCRPNMDEVVSTMEGLQESKEATRELRSESKSSSQRSRRRSLPEAAIGKVASYPRPSASPLYD